MNSRVVDRRELWTAAETRRKLGELLHATPGRSITEVTLARWIGLGLPVHQPAGPQGKRYFYSDEVMAWLDSRCSTDMPGQEVAA